MSTTNNTTNNAKKAFDAAPWKDWENNWELYLGFLSETNKYCEEHMEKFTAVVENLIEKAKDGVDLFGDILACLFRVFSSVRRI